MSVSVSVSVGLSLKLADGIYSNWGRANCFPLPLAPLISTDIYAFKERFNFCGGFVDINLLRRQILYGSSVTQRRDR